MLAGQFALAVAALFTGAAFYINIAEQPARLGLDDRALLAEWKVAYKRGYVMQASLAVVGFVLGMAAWWTSGAAGFLIGGLLMLANWPWTLIAMMPTNNALMAEPVSGAAARALLVKWNRLHAVRTALGGLAAGAFLIALNGG